MCLRTWRREGTVGRPIASFSLRQLFFKYKASATQIRHAATLRQRALPDIDYPCDSIVASFFLDMFLPVSLTYLMAPVVNVATLTAGK